MANRIKIRNQIIDFDAVEYAVYTSASGSVRATLRVVLSGQPIDIVDDAERIWKLIEASDADAPMADSVHPLQVDVPKST